MYTQSRRPSVSSLQTERRPAHMFMESKNPNKKDIKVSGKVATSNCENGYVAKWLHRAENGIGETANRDRLANPDGHERLKAQARAAGHWYTWKAQIAVALQKVAEMSDAEFRQQYDDGQTPNEVVDMLLCRINPATGDSDSEYIAPSDSDSEYIASSDSDESYNPREDIRMLAQREFGYNNDLNSEFSSDYDSSSDYDESVCVDRYEASTQTP